MSHEYTSFTEAVIAAVLAGDTCPECGAPNHLRHFDECPRNPGTRQ